MRELSRGLVRLGHEVTVITSSYPGAASNEVIEGVRISRMGTDWNVGILAAIMLLFRKLPLADVLIDEVNVFPFWTPIVTRQPRIMLIHHLAANVLNAYDLQPWTRVALAVLQKIFVLLYRDSTTVTVSESTREELIELGFEPGNVSVNIQGLPQIASQETAPTERRRVPQAIFVGRVVPQKGVELIVEAFREVVSRIPEARLVICGRANKQYHAKLERKVERIGLTGSILLLGYVSEEEKARLLRESHIFVTHPAKEGWGLSAMEAMACGTPVIAPNVPGLREIITNEETGWLVEYGNVDQLSGTLTEALGLALENDSLYAKMAEACQKLGREQSNRSAAKSFEEILTRAVL